MESIPTGEILEKQGFVLVDAAPDEETAHQIADDLSPKTNDAVIQARVDDFAVWLKKELLTAEAAQ